MLTDRIAFPYQISVLDLLLVAFAAKAMIDFWKESSLTAGWRAYFELRGGLLGELTECRFCLSYHACFWITVLGRYLAAVLPDWAGIPFMLALFALAATGVVHMLFSLIDLFDSAVDVLDNVADAMNDELPPPDTLPMLVEESPDAGKTT